MGACTSSPAGKQMACEPCGPRNQLDSIQPGGWAANSRRSKIEENGSLCAPDTSARLGAAWSQVRGM